MGSSQNYGPILVNYDYIKAPYQNRTPMLGATHVCVHVCGYSGGPPVAQWLLRGLLLKDAN